MNYKVFTIDDIKEILKKASDKYKLDATQIPVDVLSFDEVHGFAGFEADYFSVKYKRKVNSIYLKPVRFVFADILFKYKFPAKFVEHIVMHEYCHYFTSNQTKRDCGHNKEFKEYCNILNIPYKAHIDLKEYTDENSKYNKEEVYKYSITCKQCGFSWNRKRIKSVSDFESYYKCPYCGRREFDIKVNY